MQALPIQTLPAALQPVVQQHWQHFIERLAQQPHLQAQVAAWDAGFRQALAQVWGASDYVAESFRQTPELLCELVDSGDLARPYAAHEYAERIAARLASVATEDDLQRELRLLRRREMVRLIWRDRTGVTTLEELTRELSWLADACIDQALNWLYDCYCAKWGTPHSRAAAGQPSEPQRMVVIGMGKLGAGELNLSSDIDLMFAFPQHGETQGGRRSMDNQDFFIRLGQRLILALDARTMDGFVFRVDMRLRPYGQSGALALSFNAMREYYEDQGRDWERYAMIKARTVAGDVKAGEALLQELRPFVYRRYLDYGAIESLRSMKQLINREVRRKGMAHNIKIGAGGIREVEFIAQAFQLIRGGRDTELQERSLLKVLATLGGLGYLPQAVVDELCQAYVFLRNTEHALQGLADQQTQLLPADALEQARIAHALGFADWDAFSAELQRQRERVRRHFANVIAAPEDEVEREEGAAQTEWHDLWAGKLDEGVALDLLANRGYDDPHRALELLHKLRNSRALQLMQQVGLERLATFMPRLLEAVSESETPTTTLERTLLLVEAVLRRTAYLALLVENPGALKQLVTLCAASPWIAQQLARNPILLDELLDVATLYTPPDRAALRDELRQQLLRIPQDDVEAQMECLRYFKNAHGLRVAASEVAGVLPLMKVSDYLTYIAEAVLEQVLALAWNHLVAKYGRPQRAPGVPCDPSFIIVAYGKLGGIELGHGSDLDLVFIYDAAANLGTDGERSIDNSVFFTRLGQRIIHILTTVTPSGQLYDVDMRLRPSGNSGLLVSSLKAFADYQAKEAWTWEHQALVRARVVAGCEQVQAEFEAIRAATLAQPRDLVKLRADVVAMREKMRDALGSKASSTGERPVFHLKQDAGGIVDIEFMVQYGVLAWAHQYPELLVYTDNIRILDALEQARLLSPADAQTLREAYKAFRSAVHRASLQNKPSEAPADAMTAYREAVRRIWHALLIAPEAGTEDNEHDSATE